MRSAILILAFTAAMLTTIGFAYYYGYFSPVYHISSQLDYSGETSHIKVERWYKGKLMGAEERTRVKNGQSGIVIDYMKDKLIKDSF